MALGRKSYRLGCVAGLRLVDDCWWDRFDLNRIAEREDAGRHWSNREFSVVKEALGSWYAYFFQESGGMGEQEARSLRVHDRAHFLEGCSFGVSIVALSPFVHFPYDLHHRLDSPTF